MIRNGRCSKAAYFAQVGRILVGELSSGGSSCCWLIISDQAVRGQISFQCPHCSCRERAVLAKSPPTIAENRLGQVGKLLNLTASKLNLHMRQHADRILARDSGLAVGGTPVVKAIGDTPQQWQREKPATGTGK